MRCFELVEQLFNARSNFSIMLSRQCTDINRYRAFVRYHVGRFAARNCIYAHQAAAKLRKRDYQPSLVRGLAQSLPFENESFQKIVATFPSEYIVDPLTLSEMKRVLSPGGQAVILALAWITGKKWLERSAALLFRITDESPEWEDRFLEPVWNAGFQAHVDWIELKSSRLVVILAQKEADSVNFEEDVEKSF